MGKDIVGAEDDYNFSEIVYLVLSLQINRGSKRVK